MCGEPTMYKALACERAVDGRLKCMMYMLKGAARPDGSVIVDGKVVSGDGWHESELSAVAALANEIEELGEELVDRAARMREAL